MKHLLKRAICLLFYVFCPLLQAAEAPVGESMRPLEALTLTATQGEDSLIEITRRQLDDPRQLTMELVQLWNQAGQDQKILDRARLGWLLGRFGSFGIVEMQSMDPVAVLEESINLIEKHGLKIPLDELRFMRLDYIRASAEQGHQEQEGELIDLAKHVKDKHVKTRFLAYSLAKVMEQGQIETDTPAYLNDIRQMIGTDVTVLDVVSLNYLRQSLSRIGQVKEVESINRSLDLLCDTMQMRSFCSLRAYEAGLSLIKQDEGPAAEQSKAYFFKALQLSGQIKDLDYMALSYYGLNIAFNKTQQFQDAIKYGRLAYESYQQLHQPVWAASTLKNLASSYLGHQEPQIALQTAQEALRLCPPEFSFDIIKIYEKIAEIHEVLGNDSEALQYLKLSLKKKEQIKTEDADKKYMELRNETLAQQNLMQNEQIKLLTKFKIVSMVAAGLSLILCFALIKVWLQASIIRSSRQKMKDILDHIDEGILALDQGLRIQSDYSPHVDKLFKSEPGSLVRRNFLEILQPTTAEDLAQMESLREILMTCMGEQRLTWELNSSHLPNEFHHNEFRLAIHWQPIFNHEKNIAGYLVSIRDVSELRSMEMQAAAQAERVQALHGLLEEILGGNIGLIRNFLADMRGKFSETQDLAAALDQKFLALRQLHTWKGGARSLGLTRLAQVLHRMESQLLKASELVLNWNDCHECLDQYEHLLNSITIHGKGELQQPQDLYAFASVYAHEMQQRLEQAGLDCQGVTVLDQILCWRPEVLLTVNSMLLHALSNALDHGFIRHAKKRPDSAPASIVIQALSHAQHIEIRVIDNGFGIAWESIQHKAQVRGLALASRESLSAMLFEDGFSSAEQVSETSGRGVGLSAIKGLCHELGGRIALEDSAGGGTTLRMEFPRDLLVATAI